MIISDLSKAWVDPAGKWEHKNACKINVLVASNLVNLTHIYTKVANFHNKKSIAKL